MENLTATELAEAFMSAPLPDSVCSDACATIRGYRYRTGTNLLTFDEARQVFDYIMTKRTVACANEIAGSETSETEREIVEKHMAPLNRVKELEAELAASKSNAGIYEEDFRGLCKAVGIDTSDVETIDSWADRAEGIVRKQEEALRAILKEPYGCAMCDSGKLRNPNKDHFPECGFALGKAALAKEEA